MGMTPPPDGDPLPDDPHALRALVRELLDALAAERRARAELQDRLDRLLRRLYGPSSAKLPPADGANGSCDHARSPGGPVETVPGPVGPRPDRGHGRKRLPRELPRRRVVHDLTDAEKRCPCCRGPRARIGEEVTERLEYQPASLFVVEHVRPKYACPGCRAYLAVPPVPAEPLPRSAAAPGLLAQVVTAKYADHLPLHRLERILARHGANLCRSTMCDWAAGCARVLRPIYDAMCARVRDRAPGRTRTGRIWVYVGDARHPYVVYDATASRSRDGPHAFLRGFTGFVQADAFGGYDGLYATGATEVACWAHARRKFVEARDSDTRLSLDALALIRRLYDVERRARDLTPGRRRSLRRRESAPVLRALGGWLRATRPRVLPKSPLGAAITYALNQWDALNVYATDGDLAIDNNAAERALRGVAVGRKNWLFWGSLTGGRTAAVLTSLVATCQRHRIDPWAYLADVLTRLPSHPSDRLAELLPDAWGQAQRATS
jgi:transposase